MEDKNEPKMQRVNSSLLINTLSSSNDSIENRNRKDSSDNCNFIDLSEINKIGTETIFKLSPDGKYDKKTLSIYRVDSRFNNSRIDILCETDY